MSPYSTTSERPGRADTQIGMFVYELRDLTKEHAVFVEAGYSLVKPSGGLS